MSAPDHGILLALTARIPVAGIDAFQTYEAHVLPLLSAHEGTLQRRLRNADGTIEVHLVHFKSRDGFERFRSDPRRAAVAHVLASSGAVTEIVEVQDAE
jgi:hypothetical protein